MKHVNFDRVNMISLRFLLLFSAYNSASNLAVKAMHDCGFENLGFYSMALLYFVFAVASFFSTPIVNKLGRKPSLFLGSLQYFFWILCFLAPSYYAENPDSTLFLLNRNFVIGMVMLSSVLIGFGAAILWVAQGKYVSDCANDTNIGFFFSYFTAIMNCAHIVGNLIAGLAVGHFKHSTCYMLLAFICLIGSLSFLFIKPPIRVIFY